VRIGFAGMPGHVHDWVTVVPEGAPLEEWGDWDYTGGVESGVVETVAGPPGRYEARLYFGAPGMEGLAASMPFAVEP
jgi:hypothetical protein